MCLIFVAGVLSGCVTQYHPMYQIQQPVLPPPSAALSSGMRVQLKCQQREYEPGLQVGDGKVAALCQCLGSWLSYGLGYDVELWSEAQKGFVDLEKTTDTCNKTLRNAPKKSSAKTSEPTPSTPTRFLRLEVSSGVIVVRRFWNLLPLSVLTLTLFPIHSDLVERVEFTTRTEQDALLDSRSFDIHTTRTMGVLWWLSSYFEEDSGSAAQRVTNDLRAQMSQAVGTGFALMPTPTPSGGTP